MLLYFCSVSLGERGKMDVFSVDKMMVLFYDNSIHNN